MIMVRQHADCLDPAKPRTWEVVFINGKIRESMMILFPEKAEALELANFIKKAADQVFDAGTLEEQQARADKWDADMEAFYAKYPKYRTKSRS